MAHIASFVPSHALLRWVNPVLRSLLQSPLHALFSGRLLVIGFRGRKTGREFRIPISYHRLDGVVTLFSGATWPANLRDHPQVQLVVHGQKLSGPMEIVDDPVAVSLALYRILHEVGRTRMAFWFGFRITGPGMPGPEQIQAALAGRRMLRFH